MATSQAALASTAAVGGGRGRGTTSTTGHSQTIVGWHVFEIDGFSATKDLGVGKSIKSSTFRVGGHDWYIECYPCGDVEERAGWVFLCLRRQDDDDHGGRVSGSCEFTLMESVKDGCVEKLDGNPSKLASFADDADRRWLMVTDFIKREELEWLLEDDCFQVRCVVFIHNSPAAPPPPDLASETMAGSHVIRIDDGYSKTRRAFVNGEAIESNKFHVGGRSWYFDFYPCGEDKDDHDTVSVHLILDNPSINDEIKVRYEIALLTHDGQVISTSQDFTTFTERNDGFLDNYFIRMEHESSPLLRDGIQVRCDIAIVNGITANPSLRQNISSDLQGSKQVRVRGDVTFEAGGHVFAAHKCVLTTRCTAAFMTELFGPSGNEKTGATDHVHVDMEPRVFEALLHYIYTDAIPEVSEEDKVGIAQGLLVAADQYAMEKLKSICDDLLCSYINDACTAVTTLDIADKHGCPRLKAACMKYLMDRFAKVAL